MKNIILDTDLGSDCDDCGALGLIHNLQSDGKCELLGVLCNIANEYSPVAVKAINDWYGKKDVPIGQTGGTLFKDETGSQVYTKSVAEEYLSVNQKPYIENAVRLYRRLLCENDDVTIMSIGFLNNIADLLESTPDDISPLSGEELVKKSVNKIYIMGGDFRPDAETAEYNIRIDMESAKRVADFKDVAKVYLGWEVGVKVLTGHTLWNKPEGFPLRTAYDIFAKTYGGANDDGTYDRPSWDPLTCWYAICDDESFMHESNKCSITFDDKGFPVMGDNGNDTYIILDDAVKAADVIENLIGR